jgi:hypothetical protein
MVWKTNALKRVFGKTVTSNIARRAFATAENGKSLAEIKKSAAAMGHSVEMHLAYRALKGETATGGMALKAAYNAQNDLSEKDECVKSSVFILSSYYKKLVPFYRRIAPWTPQTPIYIDPDDYNRFSQKIPGARSGLQMFRDALAPTSVRFERAPGGASERSRSYGKVRDLLHRAQERYCGGILLFEYLDKDDEIVFSHAICFVGDPVTNKLSLFDPPCDSSMEDALAYDFHFDMDHVSPDLHEICDRLTREGEIHKKEEIVGSPVISGILFIDQQVDREAMNWEPTPVTVPNRDDLRLLTEHRRAIQREGERKDDERTARTEEVARPAQEAPTPPWPGPPIQEAETPPWPGFPESTPSGGHRNRRGGMAFKALYEGNFANGPDMCTQTATQVLSSYYHKLKPVVPMITEPRYLDNISQQLNDPKNVSLQALYEAQMPGAIRVGRCPRLPGAESRRDRDYRQLHDILVGAQGQRQGGIIGICHLIKVKGKEIGVDRHAVAFIGDPVTDTLSMFDPAINGADPSNPLPMHYNIKNDYHFDMHRETIDLDYILEQFDRSDQEADEEGLKGTIRGYPYIEEWLLIQRRADPEATEWNPSKATVPDSAKLELLLEHQRGINATMNRQADRDVPKLVHEGQKRMTEAIDELTQMDKANRVQEPIPTLPKESTMSGGIHYRLSSTEMQLTGGLEPSPDEIITEYKNVTTEQYLAVRQAIYKQFQNKASWPYKQTRKNGLYDTDGAFFNNGEQTDYASGSIINRPGVPPCTVTLLQKRDTGFILGIALWSFVDPEKEIPVGVNAGDTRPGLSVEGPWVDLHFLVTAFVDGKPGTKLMDTLKHQTYNYKGTHVDIKGIILEPAESTYVPEDLQDLANTYRHWGFRELYHGNLYPALEMPGLKKLRAPSYGNRWMVWENKAPNALVTLDKRLGLSADRIPALAARVHPVERPVFTREAMTEDEKQKLQADMYKARDERIAAVDTYVPDEARRAAMTKITPELLRTLQGVVPDKKRQREGVQEGESTSPPQPSGPGAVPAEVHLVWRYNADTNKMEQDMGVRDEGPPDGIVPENANDAPDSVYGPLTISKRLRMLVSPQ